MIRTEGRREGDSIVGANERRRAILEVLCQRKQDTMKNLANEFHVSLRTICYDIDELTRNYPIVTIRGKYKGGVKIADGYRLDRKYLNLEQRHLLKRLSKTLSGKDRNIMESILRDFTLKEASEADPRLLRQMFFENQISNSLATYVCPAATQRCQQAEMIF